MRRAQIAGLVCAGLGAGALLLALGAPVAQAGALVYVKRGAIYQRDNDGRTRLINRRMKWRSPSLSDNGTIAAVAVVPITGDRLYKLDRRGKLVGKPVVGLGPSTGPTETLRDPLISPHGRFVAYWWLGESCIGGPGSCRVSTYSDISYSHRSTQRGQVDSGSLGTRPTWFGNGTVIYTNALGLTVKRLHGSSSDERQWFTYSDGRSLVGHAVTRHGDKIAIASSFSDGDQLDVIAGSGRPPAPVSNQSCVVRGPHRGFDSLSWSPDGRTLAFEGNDGIYTLRIGARIDPACGLRPTLLIRGGHDPRYGGKPS